MNELKKHALLLSIVALLILVKFAVMPIMQWQDNAVVELRNLQKKLGKVSQVLGSEDKTGEVNQQVAEQLAAAQQLFFAHQSQSAFELAQQQYFEALTEKHNLRSRNFGWQNVSQRDDLALTRFQAAIRIDGKLKDIIALFVELETQTKRIEIVGFNISPKSQSEKSLGRVRSARITIALYVNQAQGEKS